MRVVSLIASSTEIVWALGFGERLVGRSHECDFPDEVRRIPACTRPQFETDAPSREIDRSVIGLLERGLSIYRVEAERLRELRPDVIITQDQCEVCAVSLADVERAVSDWLGSRPAIVSLRPDSLADVWQDIRRVAEALGDERRGDDLVSTLRQRMEAVSRKGSVLEPRTRVACVEWIDPLMAAGNWMPELVEQAGGVNLFGQTGKHSPRMSWEELHRSDPDVIFISPCGMTIEQSRRDMPVLSSRGDWPDLAAVRANRVYLADGNAYFNRPGPRLAESLEILAEILHPDAFDFGHRGTGWQQYSSSAE